MPAVGKPGAEDFHYPGPNNGVSSAMNLPLPGATTPLHATNHLNGTTSLWLGALTSHTHFRS